MSCTEIFNRVLIKLGESTISDWHQSPYGSKLNIIYSDILPTLLSAYPWRFALKRAIIAKEASKQVISSKFKYSFPLPADCLQLFQVYETYKKPNLANYVYMSDERYSEEDGSILCNTENELFIRYIYKNDNVAKFPYAFREALICKMAAEFSPTTKNSVNAKQIFEQEFSYWISQAMANNNIACDPETLPDASWLAVRAEWDY